MRSTKAKPTSAASLRGGDELGDERVEIVVFEQPDALRKAAIENRMAARRQRRGTRRRRRGARSGPSVSAEVRRAGRRRRSRRTVRGERRRALPAARAIDGCVSRRQHQLMRVRAAVVPDGHRLASPHQLRAADAEVPPAPVVRLAGLAVAGPVPAFHGQDAEAIADPAAVDLDRARRAAMRRPARALVEARARSRCGTGGPGTRRRSSARRRSESECCVVTARAAWRLGTSPNTADGRRRIVHREDGQSVAVRAHSRQPASTGPATRNAVESASAVAAWMR